MKALKACDICGKREAFVRIGEAECCGRCVGKAIGNAK